MTTYLKSPPLLAQHSPNLAKWLAKNCDVVYRRDRVNVYDSPDGPWIGWIEDETWFIGSRLWRALGVGTKAEMGCWTLKLDTLILREGFWDRYAKIGRCEIDQDHARYFIGSDTRWTENGDTRTCNWCGDFTQKRERYEEVVQREKWVKQ
jgi:hypothetical protein